MKWNTKGKTLSWWLLTLVMAVSLFAVLPMSESAAVGPVTLYVYSDGGNDGSDGSLDNPYATINKALTVAQTVYSGNEVIMYLMEGDYIATEYITHANLTIEAFSDGEGNYDEVTIYPDYDSALGPPTGIWTAEWIFAANSLATKLGFTLSHVNLSGDNSATGELVEDGLAVTGVYIYDADVTGSHVTLEDCNVSNIKYGLFQHQSDAITVSVQNTDIEAELPVYMNYGASLNIEGSNLKMTATSYSSSVITVYGNLGLSIKNNVIEGNAGVGQGIYGDGFSGEISGNRFLNMSIALEMDDIASLLIKDNYVETTDDGFDLETCYASATISLLNNTIINKGSKGDGKNGIYLYSGSATTTGNYVINNNELVNFAYGVYYYGNNTNNAMTVSLGGTGLGNIFRGNTINLYAEDLRTTSLTDLQGTDWGSTDIQEIIDRIYIVDVYPSADSVSPVSDPEVAFVFDETPATSALDTLYVDDDYSTSDAGGHTYGTDAFSTIQEALPYAANGGTIYIADGQYYAPVWLDRQVTLAATGSAVVLNPDPDDDSWNSKMVLVTAEGVTIDGIIFNEGQRGICFDRYTLRNYSSRPKTFSVLNCEFVDQTSISIEINDGYSDIFPGEINIGGNTFRRSENNELETVAFYILSQAEQLNMVNNSIYNYSSAGYTTSTKDILIDNNVFSLKRGLYVSGLYVTADGNVMIRDNTFEVPESYANDSGQEGVHLGISILNAIPETAVTKQILRNTIEGFNYGIYINGTESEEYFDIVIGGAEADANNLSGNQVGLQSWLFNFNDESTNATYNIWGVDSDLLWSYIQGEHYNNSLYGPVNYLPVAAETPLLTGLTVSTGTLTPGFDSEIYDYAVSVPYEEDSITVTPTASIGTVTVNDAPLNESGSSEISLTVGLNEIPVTVANGELSTTYTVTVTRAAAVNTGSSGSSYTPPAIEVTTEKINDTTTTSTEVSASGSSGVAEAGISTAVVDALLNKAAAENGTSKGDIMEVSVDTPTDTRQLEVNIPQAGLNEIASESDAGFAIISPFISITFDGKAIETISGAAEGGNITVSAGIIDGTTLSEKDRAKAAGRPVYDLSVKNGDVQVSHFGGGHATVRIPYTLKQGENPNAVVIYYLSDDGNLKVVRGRFDAAAGAVVFKTSHFSNFVIGHNPVTFSDVRADAWYRDAVDFIAARGITSGTGDGIYSPDMRLTRGQFMVLLMNAYQIEPASGEITGNFADAGNTYYTSYLAAAKSLGISNGVGNNMFAPDKEITRQEMFVLLYNALQLIDELPAATNDKQLGTFSDAGQVAAWANEAMSALVRSGVVSGSDNILSPAETTTRAQMAQVLYNLLAR
ncbi:S-layer homology domain-containing protein [Phosphitispora fastidiosa]|uniref:S-layer homology domain-containing protein n=1 Tax=Phosphitispora fastidiosa TaxID=2837202 RepID=UPI001E5280E9|nr:S-layer homology domain-containing protein [Phosphitispora fastidiosa]MBU7006030.1 hypothetical protein [Phosphitispora fastidiosa]